MKHVGLGRRALLAALFGVTVCSIVLAFVLGDGDSETKTSPASPVGGRCTPASGALGPPSPISIQPPPRVSRFIGPLRRPRRTEDALPADLRASLLWEPAIRSGRRVADGPDGSGRFIVPTRIPQDVARPPGCRTGDHAWLLVLADESGIRPISLPEFEERGALFWDQGEDEAAAALVVPDGIASVGVRDADGRDLGDRTVRANVVSFRTAQPFERSTDFVFSWRDPSGRTVRTVGP